MSRPRLATTTVPTVLERASGRICVIDGCGKPWNARGYCSGHYRRYRLGLSLDGLGTQRPGATCSRCDRPIHARGLCNTHYQPTRLYGLSDNEVSQIRSQICEVCGATPTQIDHDHTTGRVRGALCRQCNIALGILQDDLERIAALGRYLERANS